MKHNIKFRGRNMNGNFVYGNFLYIGNDVYVGDSLVDPDSIARFVGYDADGNEVYEGDKVISEYGDEVVARLMDNLPPKAKLKLSEDTE